jgi:hypothetical protein
LTPKRNWAGKPKLTRPVFSGESLPMLTATEQSVRKDSPDSVLHG